MGNLHGKVGLITGAAARIGATTARLLHQQGLNLVIHYRSSEQKAKVLQAELEQVRPNSVSLYQGDLSNDSTWKALAEHTKSVFGRCDVLINNASSFFPTPVGTATLDQWDDLMGSNLKAPFFLTQAMTPMLKETQGCVINIVDIHSLRPLKAHPIYCAAKAGLLMLTKSLARELGPEIRVNGVSPGAIIWPELEMTDDMKQEILNRIPLQRQGSPDDIAKTVLFLIRDGLYISGQIIPVDGGRTTFG
ncbi:MAG: pteridine reductase [Methylococcales bacterium]|jgi:pteridine reductase|nr:pteridine reductase [Methylococcales bacterium]MBT7446052.1 pteridine reductase [Methylococcales bacterium]